MIYTSLGRGRENRKHGNEVMLLNGYKDKRAFFKEIERERRQRIPILWDDGYFLPSEDPEQARQEMLKFKKRIEKQGVGTLAALNCVSDALKDIPGQERIDGAEGGKIQL